MVTVQLLVAPVRGL